MKITKLRIGGAAALALSFGFMSCTEEDDPYNMITEKNSTTWTIDHTNSDADTVHRGYKSTNFAHAGGLVNIHFDSATTSSFGDGVMGIIFGMKKNAEDSKAWDFHVVGVRNRKDYYISTYTSVNDLQGSNFGATGDSSATAEEAEYVQLGTSLPNGSYSTTSGGLDVGIYFRDVVVDSTDTTAPYAHKYQIYFVNVDSTAKYDVDDSTGELKIKAEGASDYTVVDLGDPVYEIAYESDSNDLSEYKFAPYANVYPNTDKCSTAYIKANKANGAGTLKGTWTIPADYKHADLVEN
ncbi:MAG: hypothetical protein J6Y93_00750 [Treponema sp.]|nr:hypothetical protein [Treponema sp.]